MKVSMHFGEVINYFQLQKVHTEPSTGALRNPTAHERLVDCFTVLLDD